MNEIKAEIKLLCQKLKAVVPTLSPFSIRHSRVRNEGCIVHWISIVTVVTVLYFFGESLGIILMAYYQCIYMPRDVPRLFPFEGGGGPF